MLGELRVSQYAFARLTGRAERTVNSHANAGVIPLSFAEWLLKVERITIENDRAVIVLELPGEKQFREYRRDR
jgi:hypothetical protein